jgi:glutamate decarboxylase
MSSHEHHGTNVADEISVNPLFAREGEETIPRWRIPDGEMLPDSAYQVIHDELLLDGNARQNLATFVTTWMEPQAAKLYAESFDKNMIDKDEYPQTAAIEERCVHIADLWNSPEPHATIGASAIGSSEACMLAGLALHRRLRTKRAAAGESTDRPNVVFSSSVQVVWEKYASYWDVEPRYVPITKERPYLTPERMLETVDENTIGVVPILGVTYNGLYEPVKELAAALDELAGSGGPDVPIHIDGHPGR